MQTKNLKNSDEDDDNTINSDTTAATTLEIDPEYMPDTYTQLIQLQKYRKTLNDSKHPTEALQLDGNYSTTVKDLLLSIKQFHIPNHLRIKYCPSTIQRFKINQNPRAFYDFNLSFKNVQSQSKYADVRIVQSYSNSAKKAVKIYRRMDIDQDLDPDLYEKLKQPIKVLCKADHINIAQIENIFETEKTFFESKGFVTYEDELQRDHLYVIQDYYEGDSLFNYIIRKGIIEEADALQIAKKILQTIRYCHNELKVVIGCLNPQDLAIDNAISKHHIRLLNLSDSWSINNTHFKDVELEYIIKGQQHQRTSSLSNRQLYLAPEILTYSFFSHRDFKVEITPQVDVWALGFMVYNMITGIPPYYADNVKDLQQQMLYNDIRPTIKDNEMFIGCSDELIDFLLKTLELKPQKRLTLDQVFEHPWIKYSPKSKLTITKSVIKDSFKRLKDYKFESEFMRFLSYYIGNFIIQKEKKLSAYRLFQVFDPENQGFFTKAELSQILTDSEVKFIKEDISVIFENLDTNRDGKVTFLDVCPALINKSDLFSKYCLKEVLVMIDPNQEKLITFDNIRKLFDREQVEDILITSMIRQIEGKPLHNSTEKEGITFRNFLILIQNYLESKSKN
ncbi:protein kinase domain containing protein [Stylonychia lemnae]|uniref:Protein kinase domain containing protein n=1 Tax=Stylonychia lemnae TaxID=5949 RepID=A0A077ZPG3_STYLE|nr:protein kinase domain containing protein [Stylonychia lemnae]|eukprot:CDW71857.1 protein kinase domain containing protein [Stylonychia lemnae]